MMGTSNLYGPAFANPKMAENPHGIPLKDGERSIWRIKIDDTNRFPAFSFDQTAIANLIIVLLNVSQLMTG